MKTFSQLRESIIESSDHVDLHYDYMANHDKEPSHSEIKNHAHKHGGKTIKIKSVNHDGPGGGASEVHATGHVKHIMKLHNAHHGDNYSLDHDGHKKMMKDYG